MTHPRGWIGRCPVVVRRGLRVAGAALAALAIAGCPQLLPGGGQQPGGQQPGATSPADGQALYESLSCSSCHGADACGDVGPSLHDAGFDELSSFIRDADSPHLGGTHPDLTDDELTALANYFASLEDCPKTELTAAPQRPEYRDLSVMGLHNPDTDAYRTDCATCHGNRLTEGAPFGDLPAAHSVMRRFLGHARCLTCHGPDVGGVDIPFRSTARLRAAMFDKVSCASSRCHGASGVLPFYVIDDD